MSEDTNVMTEATPQHSFRLFVRECSTLPGICRYQSSFGTNKLCMSTLHISSRTPASWSGGRTTALSSESAHEQSQNISHVRGCFRTKMDLLRHFQINREVFSAQSGHCEFAVSLTRQCCAICKATRKGSVNNF